MGNLTEELDILKSELGTPDFDQHLDRMLLHYASAEDKAQITAAASDMLDSIGEEIHAVNERIDTLTAIKGISEMISFKYIAEKYFQKSKSWFSQRLNGHTVHGKVCRFTEEELATLRFAFQDISKKIGSLSI